MLTRLSTFAIIVLLFFSSCQDYVQVVYTKPLKDDVKTIDNIYVYDNEDLRIVYVFWTNRGQMGFILKNKSDKPIYIDWNKSSLISGTNKLPYYQDRITTSGYGVTAGASGTRYGRDWLGYLASQTSSLGASFSSSTTVKEERITFIPPGTTVERGSPYSLFGNIQFTVTTENATKKLVKGVPVYEIIPATDMTFRNFLTYSHNENFANEKYVDNGFRVSKILSMKTKDFVGEVVDYAANTYCYPFERMTRFYIEDLKKSELFGDK